MTTLSLGEAARQANVSESTVLLAIRNGRIYASQDDEGIWAIDPSEFLRVYGDRRMSQSESLTAQQDASPSAPDDATGTTAWMSAVLETQIEDHETQLEFICEDEPTPHGQGDGFGDSAGLLGLLGWRSKRTSAA